MDESISTAAPAMSQERRTSAPGSEDNVATLVSVVGERLNLMNHQLKQPKRQHARLAVFCVAVAMAVLCVAAPAWSHSSSTAAKRPTKPLLKVTARIRVAVTGAIIVPVKVFFSPSVINVGTVNLVASNYDPNVWHQLSINGVNSRWMGPGGKAVMKVTFKRPGIYTAGVNAEDGEVEGYGVLKVIR